MASYTVENTSAIGKPVKVFVDGNPVENAIYANTDKCVVRYHPKPVRTDPKHPNQVYTETIFGKVTIQSIDE